MATRIVTMLGVDTAVMFFHTTGGGATVICELELHDDAGGTFRVQVDPTIVLGAGFAAFKSALGALYNAGITAAGFA